MLRKVGKVWHVRIKWKGRDIRKSTGSSSKEQARRIEAAIKHRVIEGSWFERDSADVVIFRDVWEKYMREDAQYKAQGTYQRALQCSKNFLPVIGEKKLSEITPAVLSGYTARRREDGVTASTIVKELQFIRRVFSLCKRDWQLIAQSPFELYRMPSANDLRVKVLEQGEYDRLLFHCVSWLKPIVALARFTGMRRGNILSLTWSQVDLANRVINLNKTKTGQRQVIPLSDVAYETLAWLRSTKVIQLHCPYVFQEDGRLLNANKVSMAFRRACNRAGRDDFRFHDLRHDFASALVQNGNDLYVVQQLLGHKDGRMTQRYAHLRTETLRKAVETLDTGHKKGHTEEKIKGLALANP